ncbi:MFS transporter [Pseudomonas sp. NPDC089396]|uniref:MFS transporter n=1 Tax=Pseudomonas sp. NPDC089396 TaxID=3364461 RepID=UPI0038331375
MTYRYRIATVFLIGFFIDCINIFMSAVALPSITADLQISNSTIAWVANAYILGLTLIIPVSTWLAARWGAKAVLTGSMLLFSVSAWMCGQATHFSDLVIWRFIQGLAGGGIIPVGQAMTFNLFQGEQRARISTLIMAVALIAPALSPTLGGMIVVHSSWRWVFHCNVPLSLIAAALAWLWVNDSALTAPKARPDLIGLLLVSAALISVLMGMSLYGAGYSAAVALCCVILAAVIAVLYVAHYRRTSEAIVELRLLGSPRLRISILVYYAIPGIFTGVNLLNIFFLQDALHFSAQATGMFMILYASGAFVAMLLCGKCYNQVGARRLFILGMCLHSVGIAVLFLVEARSDLALLITAYSLMGIGGGLGANTAQTTALMDFTGHDTHKASVIWNINRQMTFSLGTALFLMMFNLLADHVEPSRAYHFTFLIASVAGLLPLLHIGVLNAPKDCHAQQQT